MRYYYNYYFYYYSKLYEKQYLHARHFITTTRMKIRNIFVKYKFVEVLSYFDIFKIRFQILLPLLQLE